MIKKNKNNKQWKKTKNLKEERNQVGKKTKRKVLKDNEAQ